MIYGQTDLASRTTKITTSGTTLTQIPLGQVGFTTGTGAVGFVANGTAVGDLTGFSVASAGDFNGDGLNDVLIGSPGYLNSTGRVQRDLRRRFNGGRQPFSQTDAR